MSYLKHQSREGAVSAGGREEVGEGSAAEAAGERAAGETEAGGGGEGCRAAEEEAGEREGRCKVALKCALYFLVPSSVLFEGFLNETVHDMKSSLRCSGVFYTCRCVLSFEGSSRL